MKTLFRSFDTTQSGSRFDMFLLFGQIETCFSTHRGSDQVIESLGKHLQQLKWNLILKTPFLLLSLKKINLKVFMFRAIPQFGNHNNYLHE